PDGPADAVGRSDRVRNDLWCAVLRQPALFHLYSVGLLAEQSCANPDSSRHRTGFAGGSLSVDAVLRQARLELDGKLRKDVAAGLLGARRAGVWKPDQLDSARPDGIAGGIGHAARHGADDRALRNTPPLARQTNFFLGFGDH